MRPVSADYPTYPLGEGVSTKLTLSLPKDGNLDAGDFVLDALGERWAGELCQDDYLADGYFSGEAQASKRWQYYRCSTSGQNTLLYNAANQIAGAVPKVRFNSTRIAQGQDTGQVNDGGTAFWVADLTAVYGGVGVQRGLRLLSHRKQVLIQDEISEAKFSMQWRMHTNASIAYTNQGRRASKFKSPPRMWHYMWAVLS
jgi:hypothetical protein